MMNVTEAIFARHSYRGKYKKDIVPREHLVKIMEAGLATPSGCNKQTTSLIAVDVPEDYKLVCFLPIGIAETEPLLPKKREFSQRAWFNKFGE